MRTSILAAIGGGFSMIACTQQAHADFQGLQVQSSLMNVGGVMRNVNRVYAVFNDPNDYVTGVGAMPGGSPVIIQSIRILPISFGSAYYNPVTTHGNAPTPLETFGGVDANTSPIPPVATAAFDTFF